MKSKMIYGAIVVALSVSALCDAKTPQETLQTQSSMALVDTPLERVVAVITKNNDVQVLLADKAFGDLKINYRGGSDRLEKHLTAMLKPHWLTFSVADDAIRIFRRTPAEALKTPMDALISDRPLSDAIEYLSDLHVVKIELADDVSKTVKVRQANVKK